MNEETLSSVYTPGFHASCTRKGLGLGVKQPGFTLSPGNNLEVSFPSADLHPHHGSPLASLESVTCRRQTPCMECIAESGLEPRPYKTHSPGLSEECLHRRASQVGGRSSEFLEDGESQGGAGEEEQNSHSSPGRCRFPSFAPGASSSSLLLPGASLLPLQSAQGLCTPAAGAGRGHVDIWTGL